MKTGILLLNFGEPEHATLEEVVPFLERVFNINVSLEDAAGAEARARSRRLAEARAGGRASNRRHDRPVTRAGKAR